MVNKFYGASTDSLSKQGASWVRERRKCIRFGSTFHIFDITYADFTPFHREYKGDRGQL